MGIAQPTDIGVGANVISEGMGNAPLAGLRFSALSTRGIIQPGAGIDALTDYKNVAAIIFANANARITRKPSYPYLGVAAGYSIIGTGYSGPTFGTQAGYVINLI